MSTEAAEAAEPEATRYVTVAMFAQYKDEMDQAMTAQFVKQADRMGENFTTKVYVKTETYNKTEINHKVDEIRADMAALEQQHQQQQMQGGDVHDESEGLQGTPDTAKERELQDLVDYWKSRLEEQS